MYFIWRNPLRLHIIIKRIKTGISGFKPRITQEIIKILISTVVISRINLNRLKSKAGEAFSQIFSGLHSRTGSVE